MFINFVNMCSGNVVEAVETPEKRFSCNILCEVEALSLHEIDIRKTDFAWMVKVVSKVGADPKVHFIEREKAQAFYDVVRNAMTANDDFLTIDVLEHGAI